MLHKARDSGSKYALLLLLCRHIGLLFGKRLDTNLLRHRARKYLDSPVHPLSDSLRIYFFPLWRADLKCLDSLSNSPGACARKPYPKEKNVDEKYPDKCGRGLKQTLMATSIMAV